MNLLFEYRPQGLPVACKDVTQIVAFAPRGSHFVIDLPTRRVEIAGSAPIADGLWMRQRARKRIDDFNDFLRGKRYVIHDRDPLCTKHFRELLQPADITPVRRPPRSPNLNAYAERFVRSIKSECPIRTVILGERHLRCAITEFVDNYQPKRPHQGLGNRLIDGVPEPASDRVARRECLGGLLNS